VKASAISALFVSLAPVALAAMVALLAAGCAQTDVVARAAAIQCLNPGDCLAEGRCAPTSCEPPGELDALCDAEGAPSAPLVRVGDGCSAASAGQPGFHFALCSCTDFVSAFPLHVFGGTAVDAGVMGPDSVGIGGEFSTEASVDIAGSLQVSGDLTLPSEDALALGGVLVQTPNPACNCQDENLLDIPALVRAQTTDAPALAGGFDPAQLEGVTTDSTLELSCGHYRVARIAGPSDLRIRAFGRVALFVDGDVALDGGMEVVLEAGASFDLYVAGNVRIGAAWLLGGFEQAGRVRVYVGGEGTINLAAEASIAGTLYAPRAELVTRGDLDVYGPIFVRRAAPGGELRVHAAEAPLLSCSAP
jgi:hypothetical protein